MALRMTEEEYAAFQRRRGLTCCAAPSPSRVTLADAEKPEKRSKYGNRKVEVNGMKFDSVHEADVYLQLMARVKDGELRCVCRQVRFDLPGGIQYIADFVTIKPDMQVEGVYDAKSAATKQNRVYINKKKQMKACWGIDILEV